MTAVAPDPKPFLTLLSSVKGPVDAALDEVIGREQASLSVLGEEVAWMLESALTLCRGGKRLRAGLVAAGYEAASQTAAPSTPDVVTAGVAVELLQSYFLVHDDWMDQDDTRRGNPTVHADLARRFGDSHLGACGGVLAGDLLVTLAHREFQGVALDSSRTRELLTEFTRMQVAAIAGQQLDVVGRTRNVLSVYELKTGSYTVHGPLAIGLLLGGASPDTLKLVNDFALPVGIAFQLRDDLLNLFSPPAETGKPQGSDITAGKWTWTAQWLKNNAGAGERSHFDAAFGNRSADPATLKAALEEVTASGARAATERYLAELEQRSASALDALIASLDSPERGRILLQSAVSALLHRSA